MTIVWIGIGCVVCYALGRLRGVFRGDYYFAGSWGFFGKPHERYVHFASSEQFLAAVSQFLAGDRVDMVWVSRLEDKYGGLMLAKEDDVPKLSVSFKTHAQAQACQEFVDAMARAGYLCTESSNGFNGGFGEQHRETDVECELPQDPNSAVELIETVLGLLQPDLQDGFFVSGSKFVPARGSGILPVDKTDPFGNICASTS